MTARRAGRRLLAVALLPLALLGFVAVRRVRELAADPPGEKDCPPLAPWPADTGKPTRLVMAPARPLAWAQQGGAVNDASCLNRTPVHGVVEVRDVEDVDEMLLYLYREAAGASDDVPPLGEVGAIRVRRVVFNLAKRGAVPMRIKWLAEKHLEPWLESCPVRRAQAQGQGEACLVPRNQPMHDSVRYLKNALPNETDILHEYFVPRAAFAPFVDALRTALRQADANLLNASVRVVHREDHALAYAPTDMFAIVLYLNQRTDAEGDARMRALTRRLIDLAAEHGGTFFLPYQLHYTNAQLHRAYPDAARFFAAKRRWDPGELFTSTFYETYGRL